MTRRAFTFVPVVVVLALVLAVVGFLNGSRAKPPAPPAGAMPNAAYNRGYSNGAKFGPAVLGALLVGAASAYASRRSVGEASLVFGGILTLANISSGIALYRATAGSASTAAPIVSPSSPLTTPSVPPSPTARAPLPSQPFQPGVAPNGVPLQRPDQPTPTTNRPNPGRTTPTAQPGTADPAPAPASTVERTFDDVVAPFKTELEEKLKKLSDQATTTFDTVEKLPRRERKDLDARVAAVDALATAASEASSALSNADKALEEKLTAAGADMGEVIRTSTRFSIDFNASRRAMTCDQIIRFTDDAREEAVKLRDTASNWRIEGGAIKSKDRSLQFELDSLRRKVEMGLSRRGEMLSELTK